MKKLYITALAFIAIIAAPAYTMNTLVKKIAHKRQAMTENFIRHKNTGLLTLAVSSALQDI